MSTKRQSAKKPKISVIIPVHNQEKRIITVLKSITEQVYKEFELIVIASGCTDRTEQIVSRFIKMHPKITISLIIEPNKEISKARNKGAKFAKSNLLLFLDPDTILDYNCLFKIDQYMTSEIAVATCHSKLTKGSFFSSIPLMLRNTLCRLRIIKGINNSLICWRGHFEKVKGYNEKCTEKEHEDLTQRLLKHGKYKWVPTAFVNISQR